MFLYEVKDLEEGDIFLYENDVCKVDENKQISKSYNEVLFTVQEGSEDNINNPLREKSNTQITIIEKAKKKKENKPLNKPFRTKGGKKKFGVYVRNSKGNVIRVNFGDPNMEIKRDDPERRKNFRARHDCKNKKDKTKAGYWSCKMWEKGKSVSDHLKEKYQSPTFNLLLEKERKKITKPQMKERDKIADEIQSDPDFNKRYDKSENIKPPAKNKKDIAFAIGTLIATGRGNQINRGKKKGKKSKKEQQNESSIRINTLREAIRRNSQ
jgi:hypothetical protein